MRKRVGSPRWDHALPQGIPGQARPSCTAPAMALGATPTTPRFSGTRNDRLTTAERDRLKTLERENRDLRKANEILKAASVFFAKELDGTPRR
jgi:transposase-like protein